MTIPTPPGGPLIPDTRWGSVSISGIGLMTVAFTILDVRPLWNAADVRGEDLDIPGLAGRTPYPRIVDETKVTLEIAFSGFVNTAGTFYGDPWVGLQTNWDYVKANCIGPSGSGDGTRAVVLTKPSGATVSANCHVETMKMTEMVGPIAKATIPIVIPPGRLT